MEHETDKYGMTFREIADVERITPQATRQVFNRAVRKILHHPHGRVVLTSMIKTARRFQVSPIGCGSIECRADFIELFAFDDDF